MRPFFLPPLYFIWIASNLYRRRRRHLSSPRQIQGKNDFGGTRTRKDPGGGGGRLANTRRRLGVQRGEAKKRERDRLLRGEREGRVLDLHVALGDLLVPLPQTRELPHDGTS